MITLEDVVEDLRVAEGSETAKIVNSDGDLNPLRINEIITMLNSGLSEIFKRFITQRTTVKLITRLGKRDYTIDPRENLSVNPDGCIDDSYYEGGFTSPVISINSLRTLDGVVLPLNNQHRVVRSEYEYAYGLRQLGLDLRAGMSFTTPKYNMLRTPNNLKAMAFLVDVRTEHPRVPYIPDDQLETFDRNSLEIQLPYTYKNALVYYIIHRLSNSKGALIAGRTVFHEGNNYYDMFLKECESLRNSDAEISEYADGVDLFHRRGFV